MIFLSCVTDLFQFGEVEDRIESIIIKEEGLEECLESGVPDEGLNISVEGKQMVKYETVIPFGISR